MLINKIPQEELDKLSGVAFDDADDAESDEKESDDAVEEEDKAKVTSSTEEDDVAEKARIPYSRFSKVNEDKIRAEERARLLEEQLAEFKKSSTTDQADTTEELPPEWVELYGDSDAALKAYQLQVKLNQRIQEEAANKAYEKISSREREQQEQLNANLEYIEDSLASFEETLGRKLSEGEESALLDIQDEFTPKDKDGNYIAPLLSPEKAFEVLELRGQAQKQAKINARQKVTALTGTGSEGDTSSSSGDYNPLAWGSWRSKI